MRDDREFRATHTIKSSTRGYKRGAVFELVNGGNWEQTCYTYQYQYAYRPEAELDAFGSRGRLRIEGMDWVEVKKVPRAPA